jgi:hypothetical protein
MKHLITKLLTVSLFAVFITSNVYCQIYSFPVKPGTKEWKEMDYNAKVGMSQPKMELINAMNTVDLLKNCLSYPFNKDILLFNNPNEGFRKVFENSILWKEFVKRKDAFNTFSTYYQKVSLDDIDLITDVEVKNNERFNQFFLEKLASETTFISLMADKDKKGMMKIIIEKHKNKQVYPNEYKGFVYNSTLSVMNKLMEGDSIYSVNSGAFRKATNNELFVDKEMEKKIIESAKKYLVK